LDRADRIDGAADGWLVAKNKAPKWLIYAWNVMGLGLLFNVM